jgi:hypothetical protein
MEIFDFFSISKCKKIQMVLNFLKKKSLILILTKIKKY